jgi:hypothetical protein
MKKMIIALSLVLSSNVFACMDNGHGMCVLTPAQVGLALQNKDVLEKLKEKQYIRHFSAKDRRHQLEIAVSETQAIGVKFDGAQVTSVSKKGISWTGDWLVRIMDYPLLNKLLVSSELQDLLQKVTAQTGAPVTFLYIGVKSDKFQTPVIYLGTPEADGKNVKSNKLKIQAVVDDQGQFITAEIVAL